jgi:hypothetical protein
MPAAGRYLVLISMSNVQRRSKKEDWGKLGPNIIHDLGLKIKN